MSTVRIVVTVIFLVICAATIFCVFQGKGKGTDLSGGITSKEMDTYYNTHGKKYTDDVILERVTAVACVCFVIMALVLNMGWGY